MRDAATTIHRFVALLDKGVITPIEFGQAAIQEMLGDQTCAPVAILRTLPDEAREAVLDRARLFAETDYLVKFFYLGRGETPQDAIDRQPRLRQLCLVLREE